MGKNIKTRRRKILIAVIAPLFLLGLFLWLFLPVNSGAENSQNCTYYISPSGNDNNSGRDISHPWKTIAKANSTLEPGDIVCIRAGSYSGAIKPSHSGTSENKRITYRVYPNEAVYLTASTPINLDNKSYITIDGFKMDKWPKLFVRFITIRNAKHIIIENNYMKGNDKWGGISAFTYGKPGKTDYCIIRNNKMIYADGDAIELRNNDGCNYNLIENNFFDSNTHAAVCIEGDNHNAKYNIVRNNIFVDTEGGSHEYIMVSGHTMRNLVEDNILNAASIYDKGGIKSNGEHNIFRRNTIYNTGKYGITIYENIYGGTTVGANHYRVYNNTIYNSKNIHGWTDAALDQAEYNGSKGCDYNYYKNNLVDIFNYGVNIEGTSGTHHLFTHNLIRKGNTGAVVNYHGNKVSLSEAQKNWPQVFMDNIDANPLFINVSKHDFKLRPESPAIDAGAFLTTTTNSANGTQIEVKDASYFTDGFGIVKGDLIQLEGQTQTARITKVDYNNNIITIDKPLSWHKGQGVSLPYSGSAPDIGAYEYESGSTPSINPDINNDNKIDVRDLGILLSNWGKTDKGRYDINQDGKTDSNDADILLSAI